MSEQQLKFGTAGVRALMGEGPDKMNVDTVRRISQGYADRLLEAAAEKGDGGVRMAIAYDNRRDSDLFAFESACVFVANGIETHLFGRLSATPLLSWAVRKLGCTAGVVVTASHNNRDYSGYKIYDETGCQCLTEEASRVAARIAETKATDVRTMAAAVEAAGSLTDRVKKAAETHDLFHRIPDSMEAEFVETVMACCLSPGAASDLRLVYTPLNGTGNISVRDALARLCVGEVVVVSEQEGPDPDFTTCPEPNPEKEDALRLGLALCEKMDREGKPVDILLATDPDCDRVGVAVHTEEGYVRLSGNQIGVLLFDYLIERKKEIGTIPNNPLMVTTIVSTPLTGVMAEANGMEVNRVLTGFKYIGEIMNNLEAKGEENRFLLGFEESCGYLTGLHARDKDGVNAALLIAEMAGLCKKQGKTLTDRLDEISKRYGYYLESLSEFTKPGAEGMKEIADAMEKFRDPKIQERFSTEVTDYKDYSHGLGGLPPADVVSFTFAGGGNAILRPSGTEPKLKVYFASAGQTRGEAEAAMARMKKDILDAV